MVRNYGEQGAIEILGPAYHLPPPISGTNSAWLRGYPVPPPSTLIVLGTSREEADRMYTSCRVAGHNGNALGVHNEESEDHPDIFVCGGAAAALAGVLEGVPGIRIRESFADADRGLRCGRRQGQQPALTATDSSNRRRW